jgi:hypothetical protein
MPAAPYAIDIRITRPEALFETLDPSPFHERDLDPRAFDYITGWAQEAAGDAPFRLRLHLPPDEATTASPEALRSAIRANFDEWAQSAVRQRRELFRLGRRYLLIGLTVLTTCTFLRRAVLAAFSDAPAAILLGEGLYILGWVSNWKPIETFLYEWWPVSRRLSLYRRLAAAEVEVVGDGTALTPPVPPSSS